MVTEVNRLCYQELSTRALSGGDKECEGHPGDRQLHIPGVRAVEWGLPCRTKTVRLLCDPGVDRCACLTWRVLHSFTREQEIETKVSFQNTTVELFTVSVYCQSN